MKPSFKTLTLIAAIGMSAAALFFGAEYAMSHWLGMWYITLGSLAFRIVRHLFIALQILSAILFFFGAYRFPNQLPKRNGWLIAAAIVMLLLLCGELYRMYILFYPIYYDLSLLVLSIAAAGAMWSCYAKSEESPAGKVTRYLSLLTSIAFALYFILHAILCAGWYYYNMVYENSFEMYELFEYCYQIALACAAVWLISVLIRSILPPKNDRTMKRILIFALTAVLTIAFTSCGQTKQPNQENTTEDHALALATDPIWQFGGHGEDIYDWDRQLEWYNGCRKVLIHSYDSIHPDAKEADKDLRMVDELIRFYQTEPDGSNCGIAVSYDLKEKFDQYKYIHHSKVIVDTPKGRSFVKEIKAWNDLHRLLNKFCLNMMDLGWFDGSGAGPACAALNYKISHQRLEDVKRLNQFFHNDVPLSSLLCTDTSNIRFENAVDSVVEKRKLDPTLLESLTEDEITRYENKYNMTLACRDSLIAAYNNWISIRGALFGINNESAHKDTMTSVVRELVLSSGETSSLP